MPKRANNPANRPPFAIRLEAARISAGYLEQKGFADALGVEHETYRQWERGNSRPKFEDLIKIRRHTQQSLDWLIAGEGKATIVPLPEKNAPLSAARSKRAV
jgi:transcriptional regulator with XRE-family HTH domain